MAAGLWLPLPMKQSQYTIIIKSRPTTGKWELIPKVLETAGNTAKVIAQYLKDVKQRWGLPQILAVSDNVSVQVETFNIVGWDYFLLRS